MFAAKVLSFLAVASIAVAHPAIVPRDSCSTGSVHCCDSVESAPSNNSAFLGGLIPINLQGLGVPIGLNCLPISVIGASTSGSCSNQATCCDKTDGSFGVNCNSISAPI